LIGFSEVLAAFIVNILAMEAVSTSETPVNLSQPAWHMIPENSLRLAYTL
jgi:hypothetical protein